MLQIPAPCIILRLLAVDLVDFFLFLLRVSSAMNARVSYLTQSLLSSVMYVPREGQPVLRDEALATRWQPA